MVDPVRIPARTSQNLLVSKFNLALPMTVTVWMYLGAEKSIIIAGNPRAFSGPADSKGKSDDSNLIFVNLSGVKPEP